MRKTSGVGAVHTWDGCVVGIIADQSSERTFDESREDLSKDWQSLYKHGLFAKAADLQAQLHSLQTFEEEHPAEELVSKIVLR